MATATELRRELSGVALPFAEPGAEPARRSVTSAVQQLDDYVVPRLSRLDAPALAVIGGSKKRTSTTCATVNTTTNTTTRSSTRST